MNRKMTVQTTAHCNAAACSLSFSELSEITFFIKRNASSVLSILVSTAEVS